MNKPDRTLGLYIHWPFCVSKCPYCDFNSHEAGIIDQQAWRAAALQELDFAKSEAPDRSLVSIFFGGGTPSLMDPATTQALIDRATTLWPHASDLEITLEANPSTVEIGRFRDFRTAGINRLSMGIQALNDADLGFLGRPHSVAEALNAFESAALTFDRYSFDLIYARPGQSLEQWQAELDQALTLAGGHLSLYQLTIEEGTAFFPRHARGDFHIPDEDTATQMYEWARKRLAQAGLPAYEVSNHAAAGQECRHNLVYWQGEDYVGIGPGAHGRIGTLATRRHRAPDIWRQRVADFGHGTQESIDIGDEDRAIERFMTGLRLTQGIDLAQFQRLSGFDLDRIVDPAQLADLIAEGFIIRTPTHLRTTERGMLLLNRVTEALLA